MITLTTVVIKYVTKHDIIITTSQSSLCCRSSSQTTDKLGIQMNLLTTTIITTTIITTTMTGEVVFCGIQITEEHGDNGISENEILSLILQWNLSIMDNVGPRFFGL